MLTNEQRASVAATTRLISDWSCSYWSHDDQFEAIYEGWTLGVFAKPAKIYPTDAYRSRFRDNEAYEFVKQCAEAGSELHQRALAIHVAGALG